MRGRTELNDIAVQEQELIEPIYSIIICAKSPSDSGHDDDDKGETKRIQRLLNNL